MKLKFKLTEETKEHYRRTLYRIEALKDFGDVKKGDKGGWVEKLENLSQDGNCWIYDEARVYDRAVVWGNATVHDSAGIWHDAEVHRDARICNSGCVYGNAKVYGNTILYDRAKVYGNAEVYGKVRISDRAEVYGNARIHGKVEIWDMAEVYGEAEVYGVAQVCDASRIYGDAVVSGEAEICGEADIKSQNDIVSISNLGSRNATTTFFRTKDGGIDVTSGCFRGTVEEFAEKVEKVYGDEGYGKKYMLTIEYVLSLLEEEDGAE